MSFWHFLVHIMGADGGALPGTHLYGKWNWFYFDSGFGNGSWLLTIGIVALPVYFHKQCHVHKCYRIGRYPIAGGQYKVCRRHHPDLAGSILTVQDANKAHYDWRDNVAARRNDIVRDGVASNGSLYPGIPENDKLVREKEAR